MKKFINILICLLICALLAGCSTYNDNSNVSTYDITTKQILTSEKITTEKEKSTSATTAEASIQASSSKKQSTTATTKPTKAQSTSKATTEKNPTTTKKQATTSPAVTCTVKIECTKILNNMDKLKEGHEAYVGNGIILDTYALTLDNGATAYDAVKKACSENSITINATSGSFGTYIAGFNGIDEKDCGGGSGWVYFVNDSSPSKSCSKYIIKNGDSIVFSYTC